VPVRRRLTGDTPAATAAPLPARSIKGPVISIPGLRSVLQPIASSGGQECESAQQLVTRASERLRHKARAVTPWDYERLVLDRFPEVFKVKCFPAMTSAGVLRPEPGSVLVVVVPHQAEVNSVPVFDPMLDANKLKQIRDFLEQHAAPGQATIEVRNPAYERVLVRCALRLTPDAMRQRGEALSRLNQILIDYISPWSPIGPTPRFGWSFQNDQVEAFIRGLPFVEFVTKFSMLHITQDEVGLHRLDDTARPDIEISGPAEASGDRPAGVLKISPRYPWSLAIPNRTHILETSEGSLNLELPAEVTGIGNLLIGNTFIIIR
jgi:hypothetical protein